MAIQNNSNLGTRKLDIKTPSPSGNYITNVPARVTDIILDENHPQFKEAGGYPAIGAILFEGAINTAVKNSGFAYPYNPHIKSYPLINETVLIINLPGRLQNDNPKGTTPFYIHSAGLWNHPNHNAFINLFKGLKSSKVNLDNIQNVENGNPIDASKNENPDLLSTPLNSPTNPSQNTFVENSKIRPLFPFHGDVIIEGRFGNSIRLGSTAKSDSIHENNWSLDTSTKNGDPIILLRNGQPLLSNPRGWVPITENINGDLSSIYLTSTQKIPIGLSSNSFKSYNQTPFLPSNYYNSQIILNSSKITLNSKEDDILISSQKGIGLLSNNNINLESKNITFHTDNILKLGSKNSSESVLLGDKTYDILEVLIDQLTNLAEVTSTMESFLKGENNPDSPTQLVCGNIITGLQEIKNSVLPNIKSNKVKVE